jgi:hypothetical protein
MIAGGRVVFRLGEFYVFFTLDFPPKTHREGMDIDHIVRELITRRDIAYIAGRNREEITLHLYIEEHAENPPASAWLETQYRNIEIDFLPGTGWALGEPQRRIYPRLADALLAAETEGELRRGMTTEQILFRILFGGWPR